MNERDENERDGTPEAGVPAEEIDCPSGAVVRAMPFHGTAPGYEDSLERERELATLQGTHVPQTEANAEAIKVLRREIEEHDRAIVNRIRDHAAIEERVAELEHVATSHGDEESVQILSLRTRIERLEAQIPARTERESDLERALGMRNAENRALEKELAAVRATRDRAVSESSSRGVRLEELESALSASDGSLRERNDEVVELREVNSRILRGSFEKEIVELEESVRRKDAQIAGFVEEVAKLRKAPTFAASAEAVISMVVQEVRPDAGALGGVPADRLPELIAKVEAAFRHAAGSAELPERAEYAILCNNVVDLDQVGNFGGGDLIEEDFGDLPTASTRFEELTVNAAEVRLAMIVRRYRRWL